MMDVGVWFCGMVVGLIYDIFICKELIDWIMKDVNEIIYRWLVGFLK